MERLLRAGELLAQAAAPPPPLPLRQRYEAEIAAFRQQNGCYGTPDDSHRCTEDCVARVRCMSGSLPVYLCPVGGRVHVCDGSEPHPVTIIDENGQSVCMMSSIIVAAKSFAPGRTEAARYRLGKGYAGKQDIEIDDAGDAGGGGGGSSENASLSAAVSSGEAHAAGGSSASGVLITPDKQAEELLALLGSPQEAAARRSPPAAGLDPPDYEEQLRRYRDQQRTLGEMLKRRDTSGARPSAQQPAAKKPRKAVRQAIRDDDMHREALDTLGAFFNYERMQRVEQEAEQRIQAEIAERVVRYVKAQVKQNLIPMRRDIEQLECEVRALKRVRRAHHVDRRVLDTWAQSIASMWRVLRDSPYLQQQQGRVAKKDFVLGSIYWLRKGYTYDSIEVISPDSDLDRMMPDACDFEKYGFKEAHMTRGRNLVRDAILSYNARLSVVELRNKFME